MSCLVTSSRLVFFHWKNVITLIIWPKRMPGSRYEANVIWIVNFIQYSSKQFHTIKFIVHAPWIIALLNLKNLKAIKKNYNINLADATCGANLLIGMYQLKWDFSGLLFICVLFNKTSVFFTQCHFLGACVVSHIFKSYFM